MKKQTIMILAAALGLAALEQSAQATLVTWAGKTGSAITVDYQVTGVAGGYEYSYDFTSPAPISAFEVNGNFVKATYISGGNTASPYSIDVVNGTFTWEFNPSTTTVGSYSLSYFSPFAPVLSDGSALDGHTGPYGPSFASGTANYVDVPGTAVPEPSTVMAGALMLLPFGIGAIRSIRKDRTA